MATRSLVLRATPNAPRSEFAGWTVDEQQRPVLKVRLQAPPVEGKANTELLRFLSRELGCAKGALTLQRGAASRYKVVDVPLEAWEKLPPVPE